MSANGEKYKQASLIDARPEREEIWEGMPPLEQDDLRPDSSLKIHFATADDRARFAEAIGQRITSRTRSIWYPQAPIGRYADKRVVARVPESPEYPVYIVSKGRARSRLTAKSLDKIGVSFRIVVEPQEFKEYARAVGEARCLKLPFSNLGQGSIPARNWIWDHAIAEGAKRHWILDDNISGFYRLYRNLKTPVGDGSIFRAAERFVERFENVPLAGFNYFMFAPRKTAVPPLYLNTRIYSCILIDNDLEFRWRGRYNEDTDLSLRALKAGYCTVLFNAFLCGKSATQTMKGGNTDELYKGNGRALMAESLAEQHPDVTKIVRKWGRVQHHVDYSRFRANKLRYRPGYTPDLFDNDLGMVVESVEG